MNPQELMEKIVSLSKRRGFIFQSSEVYGGLNGCWDYGPLGVELLNNIKKSWWNSMTFRDDIEGIDASILMHSKVWEASGHVANFSDPMVDCKNCKARFRVDILFDELSVKKKKDILREVFPNEFLGQQKDELILSEFEKRFQNDELQNNLLKNNLSCPSCGNKNTFTDARQFNLMFKTFVGPVEDLSNAVYLRPETAQGIFVNFLNVLNTSRQKLPFGIAQIGKAFRNEINTKNFLFRTREFEQMEMQYFVKPGDDDNYFEYWKNERMNWFLSLGMKPENLQWHKHEKLAHYAKGAFDIEFKFPFGWGEVEGIHNRTDFDLSQHEKYSGKGFKYFDESSKEKFTPFVVETSVGASRSFMAFLCAAYDEEIVSGNDGKSETRIVLHFNEKLAPIKGAILPLVNKDGMDVIAKKLFDDLKTKFKLFYDDSGAIGRRYRRQDEIGTPYCFTIDSETLQNNSITIRERDSMSQERISIDKVKEFLIEKVSN